MCYHIFGSTLIYKDFLVFLGVKRGEFFRLLSGKSVLSAKRL
ncbi:hypothetical protein VITFI_CDS2126 [Vitreoscilla filiformis]|uniref:Uncharacterized protein n=1 Tax=Vitreoscilla filiformis TaxID=63 RepID=A0A221KFT3_VITFI|nr:hypothetical protein VITFI_CDS2126 [Vitreoscilla filiformis]